MKKPKESISHAKIRAKVKRWRKLSMTNEKLRRTEMMRKA